MNTASIGISFLVGFSSILVAVGGLLGLIYLLARARLPMLNIPAFAAGCMLATVFAIVAGILWGETR